MQIWIGTSGFQYPEWKGSFYPEDLPASKMLGFYGERFNTTEINYSFRRIPAEKTLTNWSNGTPSNFRFSLKAPQKITHFARLKNCEDTLHYFGSVLSALGPKLGPVLFQLPPDFTKDAERLRSFLEIMPDRIRPAFEFRHESWFSDEIYSTLGEHNAALCIAENEELSTPPIATADFGYLRLRREDYSPTDIDRWAHRVQDQQSRWSETFIYFKHEEAALGPKFARQMLDALPAPTRLALS